MSQKGVFSFTSQVLEASHGTGTSDLVGNAAGTTVLPKAFHATDGPFAITNNKSNPQGPITKCQLHVDVVAPSTTKPTGLQNNAALAEMVRIAASEEVNGTTGPSTVKSVYVRVEFQSVPT